MCRVIPLVLAACRRCKRRMRVLPRDVLPYKRYALPTIEHLVAAYFKGSEGLREVAWGVAGEETPAYSTLHAWTEGLGAHALGWAEGDAPGATPASALFAETQAHKPEIEVRMPQVEEQEPQVEEQEPKVEEDEPQVKKVKRPAVNPLRYRSEGRRDRLAGGAWLVAMALLVTGELAPLALSGWCALGLTFGLCAPLRFRTGLGCTRPELIDGPDRARSPT